MKTLVWRLTLGLALFCAAGLAVAAPRGLQFADVLLNLLLIFWIGLPVLLVAALVWQFVRARIASFRQPAHIVPDTDLMT